MINLLRHLYFLKACYLIKIEFNGHTYYPSKVDKTYLPETLNIRISEEKEPYTTDWLFDVLSSSCINARQEVPELLFEDCQIETAELKDNFFVIKLKGVFEKPSMAQVTEVFVQAANNSHAFDAFRHAVRTFDEYQNH